MKEEQMANVFTGYEHYLARGQANRMRLLMQPDQIPTSTFMPVLWQCLVTGTIEDRSYHSIPKYPGENNLYGSHGQQYWARYQHEYYDLADQLGIEFVYDEVFDFAPSHTRAPVKWRTKRGEIICISLHRLKYGKIPQKLQKKLGLIAESEAL